MLGGFVGSGGQMMTESPDYLAGRMAHANGKRPEDCPHEVGGQAEDEWLCGFFDAEIEADEP
jgi:hypothetical protein